MSAPTENDKANFWLEWLLQAEPAEPDADECKQKAAHLVRSSGHWLVPRVYTVK